MTWRDIDNVVLGGALQGIGGVAGELLSAAGDRALAHGMNHATGLVVGYGTEWHRALLMTSKHRPTKQGSIVGHGQGEARSVQIVYEHGHRTNESEIVATCSSALESGEPVELELWDGSLLEGIVTGIENTGLWLDDEWVEGMEVRGVTVWTMYQGDQSREYEVGR